MSAKLESDIDKPERWFGCLVGGCCVNESRIQMGESNALGPPTQAPH